MKPKKRECIISDRSYTYNSKTKTFNSRQFNTKRFLAMVVLIIVSLAIFWGYDKCNKIIAYNRENNIHNKEMTTVVETATTYQNEEEHLEEDYLDFKNMYISTNEKELTTEKLTEERIIKTTSIITNEEEEPADKEKVEYTFINSSWNFTKEDIVALQRIVEAEATNEDIIGKILIANVVLNRVRTKRFPNSVYGVVHQKINGKAQFSPIDDGRYYSVKVTKSTKEAVERALNGEDYSKGALFFVARKLANEKAVNWFDTKLTRLFRHGVHEFYKY